MSRRVAIVTLALLALCLASGPGSVASPPSSELAPSSEPAASAPSGAPEPSGPLNAGARLVRLIGSGSDLRAVVEMKVLSHMSAADVEVSEDFDTPGGQPSGRQRATLAKARVRRGEPQSLTLELPVMEGTDNHLRFRVTGKRDSGGTDEVSVYLAVPLDESTAPQLVGDCLVYQGTVVLEEKR